MVRHLESIDRLKFMEQKSFSQTFKITGIEKSSTSVVHLHHKGSVVGSEGGAAKLEGTKRRQRPLAIAGRNFFLLSDSANLSGCQA